MTALAVVPEVSPVAELRGVVATSRVGIELDENIRFNDWRDVLEASLQGADGWQWFVADCVAFGLKKLRDDRSWSIYSTLIDSTYERKTLRNMGVVARAVKRPARRDILSFAHHAEVASLSAEEQRAWLDDAISHNWTRNELRAEIAAHRAELAGQPRPQITPISVRVAGLHDLCSAEAERIGVPAGEWAEKGLRWLAEQGSPHLRSKREAA